jgi:deoxyribodipyrimidine photo-lyase
MDRKSPVVVFWFRRDLRLEDNAGLFHALRSGYLVMPVFILDTEILDKLEERTDRRVTFIVNALKELNRKIAAAGSSLRVYHGNPVETFRKITDDFEVKAVYANNDYEPYAILRDNRIASLLKSKGIPFHTHKDQVIFEKQEVTKSDGTPYTVFTPYSRAWKKQLTVKDTESFLSENLAGNFLKREDPGVSGQGETDAGIVVKPPVIFPTPEDIGFITASATSPVPFIDHDIIRNYHFTRDYPSLEGTTRLGVHLRFGTVSIRSLVRTALELNETWLNELIWREFFMSILWSFPHVTDSSFKRKYDAIAWRNNEEEFDRWCKGTTGYPIVDAGMRELNATGFMHNRVRMITASFLAKHLLADWRWGEAYFAEKLLDYELSSNNGNWQWAAGTGCDAAPYFRVFNPSEQTRKFDPDLNYVRKWVPELDTPSYPSPMVDHAAARKRALETYAKGIGNG